jgi:hypothetical protein
MALMINIGGNARDFGEEKGMAVLREECTWVRMRGKQVGRCVGVCPSKSSVRTIAHAVR